MIFLKHVILDLAFFSSSQYLVWTLKHYLSNCSQTESVQHNFINCISNLLKNLTFPNNLFHHYLKSAPSLWLFIKHINLNLHFVHKLLNGKIDVSTFFPKSIFKVPQCQLAPIFPSLVLITHDHNIMCIANMDLFSFYTYYKYILHTT